jgi:hypothetical protein
MLRWALEWKGDICDLMGEALGFAGGVWLLWIQEDLDRIEFGWEVDSIAKVLGQIRLAEPDRMVCLSIAGRTSDAIFGVYEV